MRVHLVVPAGFEERPSGGNVYDARVRAGLVVLGWDVVTHEVEPTGPLPELPSDALVLVDGLVASGAGGLTGTARTIPLVHMLFGTPGERELLRSAPAVVTTSDWTRRWLVEHHGLDFARVHVAVPGVDVADPVPGTQAGGELLCVAGVLPAKGHDVLLSALAGLTDLDWRCTLVGALDLDEDFVDELHKAAADSGIGERVAFAGALPHDDVRAAYAAADLVVLPSRAETYGMVVTEALAHGLPVGALVLADSLVVSWAAEELLRGGAVVVPLVHMAFETPGERDLLRAAPAVVATSEWSRRRLVEHDRLDADRVHVAVPGVDMADPVTGSPTGGELLCVASVIPGKGQDVLLAALAGLADLDWRCTLVGPADLDVDFVDALHKTAADTGIADRVVFAGALARRDLAAAYAGADLLVLPSRGETYAMVVTEALAHGLPVVASAVGGVPEALGHGDDGSVPGLLVRPDDPTALAAALRRWLEDPHRRRRLGRSAGLRRLTLPTWSQTSARVAAALESSLEAVR